MDERHRHAIDSSGAGRSSFALRVTDSAPDFRGYNSPFFSHRHVPREPIG